MYLFLVFFVCVCMCVFVWMILLSIVSIISCWYPFSCATYLMVLSSLFVIMCVHGYVDESADHGMENSMFVLYRMVRAVVYETYSGG